MKSPISFEAILNHDYRWPQADDQLFSAADDRSDNAVIWGGARTRIHLMAEGYIQGARRLIAEAEYNIDYRDSLVYPIVFLCRHFIELSLKASLEVYGPRLGIKPNRATHRLHSLWIEYVKLLRSAADSEGEAEAVVARCIAEFDAIDPGSFHFRYSLDKNGRELSLAVDAIDLCRLRDVMDGLYSFFLGTDGLLDDLTGLR